MVGDVAVLARTCPDLVLYQRNERDGLERYTYEFSETVNGNLHPEGSTVTVRCKERGQDARVFVYDKSSTYIADRSTQHSTIRDEAQRIRHYYSPAIVAACDRFTRRFMLQGSVLDQVYCGQRPPFNSQNFRG